MINPGYSTATSSFNEGMLQIQRLHDLWVQANYASRNGDFKKWRWLLDTIWRELSRDAIRLASKKLEPGDFKNLHATNGWFQDWQALSIIANNANTPERQYQSLNSMEIFLRTLQDRAGKGGKYKDPDNQMD